MTWYVSKPDWPTQAISSINLPRALVLVNQS
jgi:hypothetical protein